MPPRTTGGGGIMFSGCPSVRPDTAVDGRRIFNTSRDAIFLVLAFDATYQRHSSCEWAFLIRFPRSEVKGQGHSNHLHTVLLSFVFVLARGRHQLCINAWVL